MLLLLFSRWTMGMGFLSDASYHKVEVSSYTILKTLCNVVSVTWGLVSNLQIHCTCKRISTHRNSAVVVVVLPVFVVALGAVEAICC